VAVADIEVADGREWKAQRVVDAAHLTDEPVEIL